MLLCLRLSFPHSQPEGPPGVSRFRYPPDKSSPRPRYKPARISCLKAQLVWFSIRMKFFYFIALAGV